ncbi:MAG: hypothetical protein JXA43_01690 [Candidatus Diapherotrites archaeon]|nr:hypothetical protein [Candidatus Diapherotrites archaeon]
MLLFTLIAAISLVIVIVTELAIPEQSSDILPVDECGVEKQCETGQCTNTPQGNKCLEDPCSLCGFGKQCRIMESYPLQVACD